MKCDSEAHQTWLHAMHNTAMAHGWSLDFAQQRQEQGRSKETNRLHDLQRHGAQLFQDQ